MSTVSVSSFMKSSYFSIACLILSVGLILMIMLDDQLLRRKPLYDLFSEDFDQTVRLADEELYASIASKDDAKQLMIPEGAPVLHLVRQTYNMKNEIIEFTLSVARADQFHYQIRHIRNS